MLIRSLAALLLCTAVTAQELVTLSSQQVLAMATDPPRTVEVNRPVDLTLQRGSGVTLDCKGRPAGIARIVLALGTDAQLWVTALDPDGQVIEHSSAMGKWARAILCQIGHTEVVVHGEWTWSESAPDQQIEGSFRISNDRVFHQKLRERIAKNDGDRTATFLRSDEPFLPTGLPEEDRIAGWARLWSEVKYNFAFFDQVPELDWDAELLAAMPAVRAATSDREYYRVLQRSMAKLKDGHTQAYGPGLGLRGSARLPIAIAFDTDRQLRIQSVLPLDRIRSNATREALAEQDLRPGDRITHWNGKSIDELLDAEIRPLICASTPQGSDLTAARMLASGAVDSEVELRIERSGQGPRDVMLKRGRFRIPSRYSRRFEVRMEAGNIAYVSLPSFGNQRIVRQFEAVLPKIREAKAVIFDVRGNGGGNSGHGWAIASHLIEEPIPTTRWKTPLYRPAFRAWGRPEAWHEGKLGSIEPAEEPFTGPVAILVGPETFSAAEDFVAVLHASKRALVVGRPTGGSTGQPLRIKLPGGGGARICTKRDTYPDGTDFVGVGIQPDLVIDPMQQPGSEDPELQGAIRALKKRLQAER